MTNTSNQPATVSSSEASVPAPPARPLPEGVQCIACGYSLCGLTVERDCPECGVRTDRSLLPDEAVLPAAERLENQLWSWQLQSVLQSASIVSLLLAVVILYPGLVIAGVFAVGVIIVHLSNGVGAVVTSPAELTRNVATRWFMAFLLLLAPALFVLCFQSNLVGRDWGAVLMGLSFVSYAASLLLHGHMIHSVYRRVVPDDGVAWLGRFDWLSVAGFVLLGSAPIVSISGKYSGDRMSAESSFFFLVVGAILLLLVGGIAHAIAVNKPRKHLAILIANSRAYRGTR